MVSVKPVPGGYIVEVNIQLAGTLQYVDVISSAIQELRCDLQDEYSKRDAESKLAELQTWAKQPMKTLPKRVD